MPRITNAVGDECVELDPLMLTSSSADNSVAYPDEKLYAEDYKRSDDSVAYPDEKLYAEDYKRSDDSVAYPDEKLYAEDYKRGRLSPSYILTSTCLLISQSCFG